MFHDLRPTFATTALQNDVDVKKVFPFWDTTTPGSPFAPTPTPPARSRTKPPKPWGVSWRRCGKNSQKESEQRTGWEAELPCRCAAFFHPYPKGMSWQ